MDNYERVQLCDVLREEKHAAGEVIITEVISYKYIGWNRR